MVIAYKKTKFQKHNLKPIEVDMFLSCCIAYYGIFRSMSSPFLDVKLHICVSVCLLAFLLVLSEITLICLKLFSNIFEVTSYAVVSESDFM